MIKMNRMKLYKIVEYLKSVDFYHDTFDLEEEGIPTVLSEYGIYEEFTEEELQEVKKDLTKLAEQNEFREATMLDNNTVEVVI